MDKKRPIAQPTKPCQYGTNCYRKNPTHFTEYFHDHLNKILSLGRKENDGNNEYQIPDELFLTKSIIKEQLDIMENLFPHLLITTKRTKLNEHETGINKQLESPLRKNKNSVEIAGSSKTIKDTSTKVDIVNTPIKAKQLENKQPVKITANQLKESLKATLDKVTAINSQQSSASSSLVASSLITAKPSTQLDQLADYRQRHIQKRKENPTSVATSSVNHSNRPKPPSTPKSSSSSSSLPSTSSGGGALCSTNITKNINDYISVVNPKGKMADKLKAAAPYNFFLTTITDSKQTHSEPLSITFQEILDSSLGEIESTVQINFMVDIGWLLGHYYFAGILEKPLLVLYGDETPDLQTITTKKPQVTAIKIKMSSPFGTHHTKMMLIGYKDGSMRVVVSTANLVEDDWHNRTQGIWLSPRCYPLADGADTTTGDSPTGFRDDIIRYFVSYNIPKIQPWIARIRKTNFSSVNVCFVASVPGGHRESGARGQPWGHARVGNLLAQHCAPVPEQCSIIAQSSSIGSLGPSVQTWIMADIVNSFRKDNKPIGLRRLPIFKMIYPSFANVKGSHDDLLGGGGLPYRKAINDKQPWLKGHLHQWKSKARYRNQAMPHIKTYCRWTENVDGIYWFLLTSANLSKAAWGAFNKGSKLDLPLRIMNYEAGVLFLPKFILKNGENCFPLNGSKNGVPKFPMPYDLPIVPYSTDDTPFFMDYLLS